MIYIPMMIMEEIREGKKSVSELMGYGKTLLNSNYGWGTSLIEEVQVEAHFPDGVKLVSIHKPINPKQNNVIPVRLS